jgi:3'-5' exoribonuclease
MQLRSAKAGEEVLGFYALSKAELIPFTGGVRLSLEVSDASGRLAGIMWGEEAESAHEEIKDAQVVKVKGIVGEYRGSLQLQVEKIRAAKPEEYDLTELVATSQFSVEELEAGIEEIIHKIPDEQVRQVVIETIYSETLQPRYFEAPAGTRWHHGYLRGLAEHSLSIAQAADKLCDHYEHLDRSLMIAGGLLHDIGKVNELSTGSTLSYSTDGRLFGHIVMGWDLVRQTAERLGLLEDVNVKKLLHMILSHQGKKEYSVPVEPAFEEAFVLYFLDEIDSKLNAIGRIRNKPENEGAEFSSYVNLLQTQLYLRKKKVEEEEQESQQSLLEPDGEES